MAEGIKDDAWRCVVQPSGNRSDSRENTFLGVEAAMERAYARKWDEDEELDYATDAVTRTGPRTSTTSLSPASTPNRSTPATRSSELEARGLFRRT